jgi:fimbrial chaperone protein
MVRVVPRRLRHALAALLLAAGGAGLAQAGSFSANPVRLSLPAGATSTSVALTNQGPETVTIQTTVMAWQQDGGRDVLTPSQDLVVSPPIFKVAPGATQTVRVGLLRAPDRERELTYRLFLQEVPPPRPAGEQGVSVALQLALPVFVQPPGRAAPSLAWQARPTPDGALELSLANSGTAHVQVVEARLVRPDGSVAAESAPRVYVLPGQSRSWSVKPDGPLGPGPLRVVARTGSGEVSATLPDR